MNRDRKAHGYDNGRCGRISSSIAGTADTLTNAVVNL
jgi:hypothetical protein